MELLHKFKLFKIAGTHHAISEWMALDKQSSVVQLHSKCRPFTLIGKLLPSYQKDCRVESKVEFH